MGFPKPTILDLGDVNIAVYQKGEATAPPVVLIHGWPEMAYSWKSQLPALARAGYRAIAMDLRGFGHSDAPTGKEHYHITKMVGDIEHLLDKLAIREAVLVGHDWGGIIVWHAARMISERVRGVISICTPHTKYPPVDPLAIFEKRHGKDHYFVAYQQQGVAETLFDQDPLAVFKMLFRTVPKGTKSSHEMYHLLKNFKTYLAAGAPDLPGAVMSREDMQVFAGAYTHSGFHGGINLYRNTTENWQYGASL
ncbi:MAG TPA: alpha/beta hydrolase, partial [Hellea balneolensis]|nr:alpha/beta hydrolase [Hellea balneolensis]